MTTPLPDNLRARYDALAGPLADAGWTCEAVDFSADFRDRRPCWVLVTTRRQDRQNPSISSVVSESTDKNQAENLSIIAGQGDIDRQGQNAIWEGDTGPVALPRASVAPSGSPEAAPVKQFGDLPTVKAMGSGQRDRVVIGFDTEFFYPGDGDMPTVLSYQFHVHDPRTSGTATQVCLYPLALGDRVLVEDALMQVVVSAGLWTLIKEGGVHGLRKDKFWITELHGEELDREHSFKVSMGKLWKDHRLDIVLACHFGKADLTQFRRPSAQRGPFADILRHVTSAGGGWVSLQPVHVLRTSGDGKQWWPMSVSIRDSKAHAPAGSASLDKLGETCGIPKIEIDFPKNRMDAFLAADPVGFAEYAIQDSRIVVEYLARMWGDNVVPPVTISSGGAKAVKSFVKTYWKIGENADFMARFQGLVTLKDDETNDEGGLDYYVAREQRPVDGDATVFLAGAAASYHGGLNTCPRPGYYAGQTYDLDIQSAYPTAMSCVLDIDFEKGCIEESIEKRDITAEDFPQGFVTPLVGYVSFEFPEGVEPCIPVLVDGSVVYPRTSAGCGSAEGEGMEKTSFDGVAGVWAAAPEMFLAVLRGASVWCQRGYRGKILMVGDDGQGLAGEPEDRHTPSRALRRAMTQLVEDRGAAKAVYGKKSVEEQTIKLAANGPYGKLAQDVSPRAGWNAFSQEMESVGGSAITSPYHATMTTSLVRALLLAAADATAAYSTTTDGFIGDEVAEVVEGMELNGLTALFREAREALTGDPTIWEAKHEQRELLNVTTRGNVGLSGDGGVLAKAGLKVPGDVEDSRAWFIHTILSRDGRVPNAALEFPSARELTRTVDREPFHARIRDREIALDYDLKRRPVEDTFCVSNVGSPIDGDTYEVVSFDTRPWETVADYRRAKRIARHIAEFRPGTTGDARPSGCLRTGDQWATFMRRLRNAETGVHQRHRDAGVSTLLELVAGHKAGLWVIPELASKKLSVEGKLDWLASLGLGSLTESQWKHMSKKDRQRKVLAGIATGNGAVQDLVERILSGDEDLSDAA